MDVDTATFSSKERGCRLPIELCELIIDFVAIDDRISDSSGWVGFSPPYTLLACALTCHAWLPRSRLYLSRDITLSDREQLSLYVSTLRRRHETRRFSWDVLSIDPSKTTVWVSGVAIRLPFVMKTIRQLRLKKISFGHTHIAFLPSLALASSVTNLQLAFTRFSSFEQFTRLVYSFKLLKSLSLQWSTIPLPESETIDTWKLDNARCKKLKLSSLYLLYESAELTSAIYDWLQVSSSALDTVSVAIHDLNMIQPLGIFFRTCGAAMTELLFHCKDFWDPKTEYNPQHLSLESLPSLEAIFLMCYSEVKFTSSFQLFTHILSTIPQPTSDSHSVSKISFLQFTMAIQDPAELDADPDLWIKLGIILSRLPKLEYVFFCVGREKELGEGRNVERSRREIPFERQIDEIARKYLCKEGQMWQCKVAPMF